jgi:RNA polymerase sigma-70 factor (ECF subfamily)
MSPNDISIEHINSKDANAFHLLYKKFYKALVYYAMQQIESSEVAEDIVQEVFINIWEKDLCFQNEKALNVYLYNSIRNAIINYIRHKEVEVNYIKQSIQAEQSASKAEEDDIDYIFEDDVYKQLFDMIDHLPERAREVLLLYMKGKKNKEIAEALNISLETVKTHKKRAISFLKKHLSVHAYLYFLLYFC